MGWLRTLLGTGPAPAPPPAEPLSPIAEARRARADLAHAAYLASEGRRLERARAGRLKLQEELFLRGARRDQENC